MLLGYAFPLVLLLAPTPRAQTASRFADCDSARATGASAASDYTTTALTESTTDQSICSEDTYTARVTRFASLIGRYTLYSPDVPDAQRECYAEGFYQQLFPALSGVLARCQPPPLDTCIGTPALTSLSAGSFTSLYNKLSDKSTITPTLIGSIFKPAANMQGAPVPLCVVPDASACALALTDRLHEYIADTLDAAVVDALATAVCGQQSAWKASTIRRP